MQLCIILCKSVHVTSLQGDWEQRTAMLPGPTRGSATPNWRPLTEGQFDMTGTGQWAKAPGKAPCSMIWIQHYGHA